jgi:type IV pilus assembly protein PilA
LRLVERAYSRRPVALESPAGLVDEQGTAKHPERPVQRSAGFTLVELMIAVAIIGILATIAIPQFLIYQLRSKSAEAKTNLGAIRVLENTHFSEHDQFLPIAPEPAVIPGSISTAFVPNAGFAALGFRPEGQVYFSYGVAVSADAVGFTADAGADIDTDGFVQFWGYSKPDGGGVLTAGQVGLRCDRTLPGADRTL